MIDMMSALKTFASHPEVKKVMAAARDKGVAEIISTIGLASPRSMLVPGIGIFVMGAVAGAAAAMLITPRTGEAFREDVAELVKSMRARLTERVAATKKTGSFASAGKNGVAYPAAD